MDFPLNRSTLEGTLHEQFSTFHCLDLSFRLSVRSEKTDIVSRGAFLLSSQPGYSGLLYERHHISLWIRHIRVDKSTQDKDKDQKDIKNYFRETFVVGWSRHEYLWFLFVKTGENSVSKSSLDSTIMVHTPCLVSILRIRSTLTTFRHLTSFFTRSFILT